MQLMWYCAECVCGSPEAGGKVAVSVSTAIAFVEDFIVFWIVYVELGGCYANDGT